jgi:hypothetical protein
MCKALSSNPSTEKKKKEEAYKSVSGIQLKDLVETQK